MQGANYFCEFYTITVFVEFWKRKHICRQLVCCDNSRNPKKTYSQVSGQTEVLLIWCHIKIEILSSIVWYELRIKIQPGAQPNYCLSIYFITTACQFISSQFMRGNYPCLGYLAWFLKKIILNISKNKKNWIFFWNRSFVFLVASLMSILKALVLAFP